MSRAILAFLVAFISGCTPIQGEVESPGRTLTVFAAGSLTDAFAQIGVQFEQAHAGVNVVFNFAGSQALRTQIEAGARADVFASANAREMQGLVDAGLVDGSSARQFVSNALVVILPADNPASLDGLDDLAAPNLKLVLAAEEVPAGNYSRQSLARMNSEFGSDFSQRVLANVVSNEDNVRQVVAKVELGEADAGIVYASDAVAAPDLLRIEIPPELNVVAEYPIAVLGAAPDPELARQFVEFVFGPEAQAALISWGFSPAR